MSGNCIGFEVVAEADSSSKTSSPTVPAANYALAAIDPFASPTYVDEDFTDLTAGTRSGYTDESTATKKKSPFPQRSRFDSSVAINASENGSINRRHERDLLLVYTRTPQGTPKRTSEMNSSDRFNQKNAVKLNSAIYKGDALRDLVDGSSPLELTAYSPEFETRYDSTSLRNNTVGPAADSNDSYVNNENVFHSPALKYRKITRRNDANKTAGNQSSNRSKGDSPPNSSNNLVSSMLNSTDFGDSTSLNRCMEDLDLSSDERFTAQSRCSPLIAPGEINRSAVIRKSGVVSTSPISQGRVVSSEEKENNEQRSNSRDSPNGSRGNRVGIRAGNSLGVDDVLMEMMLGTQRNRDERRRRQRKACLTNTLDGRTSSPCNSSTKGSAHSKGEFVVPPIVAEQPRTASPQQKASLSSKSQISEDKSLEVMRTTRNVSRITPLSPASVRALHAVNCVNSPRKNQTLEVSGTPTLEDDRARIAVNAGVHPSFSGKVRSGSGSTTVTKYGYSNESPANAARFRQQRSRLSDNTRSVVQRPPQYERFLPPALNTESRFSELRSGWETEEEDRSEGRHDHVEEYNRFIEVPSAAECPNDSAGGILRSSSQESCRFTETSYGLSPIGSSQKSFLSHTRGSRASHTNDNGCGIVSSIEPALSEDYATGSTSQLYGFDDAEVPQWNGPYDDEIELADDGRNTLAGSSDSDLPEREESRRSSAPEFSTAKTSDANFAGKSPPLKYVKMKIAPKLSQTTFYPGSLVDRTARRRLCPPGPSRLRAERSNATRGCPQIRDDDLSPVDAPSVHSTRHAAGDKGLAGGEQSIIDFSGREQGMGNTCERFEGLATEERVVADSSHKGNSITYNKSFFTNEDTQDDMAEPPSLPHHTQFLGDRTKPSNSRVPKVLEDALDYESNGTIRRRVWDRPMFRSLDYPASMLKRPTLHSETLPSSRPGPLRRPITEPMITALQEAPNGRRTMFHSVDALLSVPKGVKDAAGDDLSSKRRRQWCFSSGGGDSHMGVVDRFDVEMLRYRSVNRSIRESGLMEERFRPEQYPFSRHIRTEGEEPVQIYDNDDDEMGAPNLFRQCSPTDIVNILSTDVLQARSAQSRQIISADRNGDSTVYSVGMSKMRDTHDEEHGTACGLEENRRQEDKFREDRRREDRRQLGLGPPLLPRISEGRESIISPETSENRVSDNYPMELFERPLDDDGMPSHKDLKRTHRENSWCLSGISTTETLPKRLASFSSANPWSGPIVTPRPVPAPIVLPPSPRMTGTVPCQQDPQSSRERLLRQSSKASIGLNKSEAIQSAASEANTGQRLGKLILESHARRNPSSTSVDDFILGSITVPDNTRPKREATVVQRADDGCVTTSHVSELSSKRLSRSFEAAIRGIPPSPSPSKRTENHKNILFEALESSENTRELVIARPAHEVSPRLEQIVAKTNCFGTQSSGEHLQDEPHTHNPEIIDDAMTVDLSVDDNIENGFGQSENLQSTFSDKCAAKPANILESGTATISCNNSLMPLDSGYDNMANTEEENSLLQLNFSGRKSSKRRSNQSGSQSGIRTKASERRRASFGCQVTFSPTATAGAIVPYGHQQSILERGKSMRNAIQRVVAGNMSDKQGGLDHRNKPKLATKNRRKGKAGLSDSALPLTFVPIDVAASRPSILRRPSLLALTDGNTAVPEDLSFEQNRRYPQRRRLRPLRWWMSECYVMERPKGSTTAIVVGIRARGSFDRDKENKKPLPSESKRKSRRSSTSGGGLSRSVSLESPLIVSPGETDDGRGLLDEGLSDDGQDLLQEETSPQSLSEGREEEIGTFAPLSSTTNEVTTALVRRTSLSDKPMFREVDTAAAAPDPTPVIVRRRSDISVESFESADTTVAAPSKNVSVRNKLGGGKKQKKRVDSIPSSVGEVSQRRSGGRAASLDVENLRSKKNSRKRKQKLAAVQGGEPEETTVNSRRPFEDPSYHEEAALVGIKRNNIQYVTVDGPSAPFDVGIVLETRKVTICEVRLYPGRGKGWDLAVTDITGEVTACGPAGCLLYVGREVRDFDVRKGVITARRQAKNWEKKTGGCASTYARVCPMTDMNGKEPQLLLLELASWFQIPAGCEYNLFNLTNEKKCIRDAANNR